VFGGRGVGRWAGQPGGAGGDGHKECSSPCSGPAAAALTPPLDLRLGLFRFPGPAPLGMAGGAMGAGRLKVEVRGDRRLGLARAAGEVSQGSQLSQGVIFKTDFVAR
jgi:hypothetical protein